MKRLALAVLVLSTLDLGAAYASAFLPGGTPGWAPWAMAIGISAMMASVTALGALPGGDRDRDRRRERATARALAVPIGFTFLVLACGFGLALALPASDAPGMRLWLGLPPRAAVIVYGVGLLPFVVLPWAYARTFDRITLRDADVERVRQAAGLAASRTEDAA